MNIFFHCPDPLKGCLESSDLAIILWQGNTLRSVEQDEVRVPLTARHVDLFGTANRVSTYF
jgi:hypothetical protein